jgi:hypothetical protein
MVNGEKCVGLKFTPEELLTINMCQVHGNTLQTQPVVGHAPGG